ncbi:hypothetical protein [Thermopirellula anaerolimosa]
MDRRLFLAMICGGAGWATLASRRLWADTDGLDPEVLKSSLRTATPEENGFIEYVVRLARAGVISPKTVQAAYLFAKRKPKHQFQYFKFAVIRLAAQEGVRL